MPIIAPIPRDERRLMQKAIHKTHDKHYARRLTAMLMQHRCDRVNDVTRTLCCARSSVGRWISNWFTLSGVAGLKSLPAGRTRRWPFEHICTLLRELVKHSLGDFGYQRSRWSTELLAIKINEITGCQLHAGTIRRWLPSAGLVWRRAAPTLRIRDTHKDEKMAVNIVLAEGKPEVQGHLSAGLLVMGESCGTAMAGTSRHDNAQSSVPFNVATVEKSSLFYGNRQPIPRRKTWAGKSVAVLSAAI